MGRALAGLERFALCEGAYNVVNLPAHLEKFKVKGKYLWWCDQQVQRCGWKKEGKNEGDDFYMFLVKKDKTWDNTWFICKDMTSKNREDSNSCLVKSYSYGPDWQCPSDVGYDRWYSRTPQLTSWEEPNIQVTHVSDASFCPVAVRIASAGRCDSRLIGTTFFRTQHFVDDVYPVYQGELDTGTIHYVSYFSDLGQWRIGPAFDDALASIASIGGEGTKCPHLMDEWLEVARGRFGRSDCKVVSVADELLPYRASVVEGDSVEHFGTERMFRFARNAFETCALLCLLVYLTKCILAKLQQAKVAPQPEDIADGTELSRRRSSMSYIRGGVDDFAHFSSDGSRGGTSRSPFPSPEEASAMEPDPDDGAGIAC